MVFWILLKIGDQLFRAVLDSGATLSIVARRLLKTFKKNKTLAIRVGDGCTIHSLGGVDVTICLGDKTMTQRCRVLDTDAFDIVIGTDFLRRNPEVKMLSLKRPYSLHCNFGSGLFSVPLELSGRKESGLRYLVGATGCTVRPANWLTLAALAKGFVARWRLLRNAPSKGHHSRYITLFFEGTYSVIGFYELMKMFLVSLMHFLR